MIIIYHSCINLIHCLSIASCNNGSVRLTDNNRHSDYGRVQVCLNGVWTTICYSSDWDKQDASVVCRQLGYSPYG